MQACSCVCVCRWSSNPAPSSVLLCNELQSPVCSGVNHTLIRRLQWKLRDRMEIQNERIWGNSYTKTVTAERWITPACWRDRLLLADYICMCTRNQISARNRSKARNQMTCLHVCLHVLEQSGCCKVIRFLPCQPTALLPKRYLTCPGSFSCKCGQLSESS